MKTATSGTVARPWSESRELALHRLNMLIGYCVLVCVVATAVLALFGQLLFACLTFILIVALSLARTENAEELNATLKNRPRAGAAGLTRFHWHNHTTISFECPCGTTKTFEGCSFYSNGVDAGGGRYSLVCGCGRGHYKFRVQLSTKGNQP